MGSGKARREAFLREHPFCCFCGGSVTAVEEDHIPARHLFRGRQWPEGFVFPACSACNDSSSMDELVLGWLVRIQVSESSAADEEEMARTLDQLNRRRPEWVHQMQELSRTETRQLLREKGVKPGEIGSGELYVVTMPQEFIEASQRYAEKLGKALYYRHVGRCLPSTGFVKAKVSTNTEFMSPAFPWKNMQIVDGRPALARSGKSLADQFDYRYAIPSDGGGAFFIVKFGESMVMTLMVADDEEDYRRRVTEKKDA